MLLKIYEYLDWCPGHKRSLAIYMVYRHVVLPSNFKQKLLAIILDVLYNSRFVQNYTLILANFCSKLPGSKSVQYFLRVQGGDCGDDVASWLHRVLNKPYRLVHKSPGQAREAKKQPATNGASKVRLSLSNEAQYLLVTWSAVEYVHRLMGVASGREEVAVVSQCVCVLF